MMPRTLLLTRGAVAVLSLVALSSSVAILIRARRESERSTMPTTNSASSFAGGAKAGSGSSAAIPSTLSPSSSSFASGTSASPAALARGNATFPGVKVRLVDELGKAKIELPNWNDRQVRALLTQHWRRHLAPFTGPGGELGRLVQSIGLQRKGAASPHDDKQDDKDPDKAVEESRVRRERHTRTFGLGEGSYDQRECIVAPTPATLRFPLHIPAQTKLRVAPALLGDAEATFEVAFRAKASAERRVLGTKELRGPTRRFDDWVIDLASAGISDQEGELELTTQSKTRGSAVALWGSPVLVGPHASRLPYNVLFIIVDAMRSDAISASHDPEEDAQRKAARHPPLDAWFAAMPEVAPTLDRLAQRGAIWEHAWSAAMWTRPATLSILTGMRASHTGIDVLGLELLGDQRRSFYSKRPPLLPLSMRMAGAATAAFVNNMYLSGSVGVGIDFAFEAVVDHRMQALDTSAITSEAERFLVERGQERFFLLLNYGSPHAPYLPPPRDLRAIRGAPNRPADLTVQNYLAEVHKDDAAIGRVLSKLEELGRSEDTLVVVTADHGETMSAAHDWVAVDVAQGVPSGRFTHLSTMWEEAARVAMLMVLPGKIPAGLRLDPRVQTLDLMPTILELEGLDLPEGLDGRSLVPLFSGKAIEDRPVVIEGRGARSIIDGKYHCILREPVARRLRHRDEEFERSVELYDLESDPGERKDIAPQHPELVAQLRAKVDQLVSVKATSSPTAHQQQLHFRFATGGKVGQLEFVVKLPGDDVKVTPAGIDARAIRRAGDEIRITTPTSGDRVVGFDLAIAEGAAMPTWEVTWNGKPWPAERVFGGALGLKFSGLLRGLGEAGANGTDLAQLDSPTFPHIVHDVEFGMFVTRDPLAGTAELEVNPEAQLEAQQAMQAWGYAKKPAVK